MSYKIYLIKHLDTDMKYVGITSQTMEKRFMQHGSDRMGALYKIMRTDKSRMRMELIEEVFDKMEALKKEQEYIRIFDTAQPNGWNRQVTDWEYGPALTFNAVSGLEKSPSFVVIDNKLKQRRAIRVFFFFRYLPKGSDMT